MGTSERLRKTFEDYTNVRCALSQNQSYNVKLKRHGTVPREVEIPSDVRSKLRLFAGPNQRATKIPYMHVYCLRPFKLFSTKLSTLSKYQKSYLGHYVARAPLESEISAFPLFPSTFFKMLLVYVGTQTTLELALAA